MSWRIKNQYVDAEIGHHVIELHHPGTGAEHILQVIVGHHGCPTCGHVRLVDNLDEINIKKIVSEHIEKLNASHAQVEAHARKHNVPLIGKPK